ncbi:multidrug and toxin extrusion protein 1 isoform X1 [Orcinus orca]|uniref:multidrug and toxin extrusion protein 1 isoform X1 n=1 Tax=Orcinus orca TaxID=9733 RepID=UPI002112FC5E|nr:multidrug and toxin extrusion protein 1 isoform X1 [Orcinus orca]
MLMSQSFGAKNLKRVGIVLQRSILVLLLCCFPCWALLLNTESLLLFLKQDPEVSRIAQIYVMILIPSLPVRVTFDSKLIRMLPGLRLDLGKDRQLSPSEPFRRQGSEWEWLLSSWLEFAFVLTESAGKIQIGHIAVPAAGKVFTKSGHHPASSGYRYCSERPQRGHECPPAVRPGLRSGKTERGFGRGGVKSQRPSLRSGDTDPQDLPGRTPLPSSSCLLFSSCTCGGKKSTSTPGEVGPGTVSRSGAPSSSWPSPACSWCALSGGPLKSEPSLQVPLGLGVAASVRVGSALGAGDAQQARHSCATALLCAGVCALVTGILLAALKDVVAYAFTSDKDVVSLVSQVMPIFAPFHLFDALAGTSGGVLRGAGKQKMGALLNAIGYYVFGFPLGASLMFAANHGIIGLWSGLTACVFFQTLFYLVYIWRINWNRAAEQAQVRAGLRGTKEAVPTATDLSILDKDVADGVILPDVIQPESQTTQLVENSSCGVATIGEVLTGAQLILYHGAAVVLAFAVLVAGILIRVFTDRG